MIGVVLDLLHAYVLPILVIFHPTIQKASEKLKRFLNYFCSLFMCFIDPTQYSCPLVICFGSIFVTSAYTEM